ncbi:MAG: hypothetical protein CMP10_01715, partial [Zetaproteobacteria bacterium]|nr:hypothetical protein [Pseudobdellovibrionaceae bacterium]
KKLEGGVDQNTPGDGLIPTNPSFALGTATQFDDHLSETMFYARELSNAEVFENDLYLQQKWGQLTTDQKAPGGVHYGLALWLDANDTNTLFQDSCSSANTPANTDYSPVTCWHDKSGLGNHVEGVSNFIGGTYTLNAMNGRPAIASTFDRGFLGSLPQFSSGAQEHTIFVVAKSNSNGGSFVAIGNSGETSKVAHLHNQGSETLRYSTWGYYLDKTVPDKHRSQHVYTGSYDGTTGYSWHNGKYLGSEIMPLDLAAAPTVGIGRMGIPGFSLLGKIAEVVIYNRQLSATERQAVEAYLAQKWLDEPYYLSCAEAQAAGETMNAYFTIDADGYNGPAAPAQTFCN